MIAIKRDISVAGLNSFGIEAKAAVLFEFATAGDLTAYFSEYPADSHRWYVLGGGNNILFTGDYDGALLHPVSRGIEVTGSDSNYVYVRVAGGTEWDDLVEWSVEQGLGGLENLSLIPGYVGAAPVQNIGAYGVELKDTVQSVEVFITESGEVVKISAAECAFGYRDSIFKRELGGKAIILSVTLILSREPHFRLDYGDIRKEVEKRGGVNLRNARDAVISIRKSKLPDPEVLGNAGSFFRNPVVHNETLEKLKSAYPEIPYYYVDEAHSKLAAGWLIDKAGWKGKRVGNVGVHENQALVVVNYGGAAGSEILTFSDMVRRGVREKFGIQLETEVNIL